ncbi:MAG: type II toxin-antitoxin system PemK/MazF family toxin [Acidimicrobiales bacterium]
MGAVRPRTRGVGQLRVILRGEVYDVDLGQPVGHEPAHRHPAVVVSADIVSNSVGGLVAVVPITSRSTGCAATWRWTQTEVALLCCFRQMRPAAVRSCRAVASTTRNCLSHRDSQHRYRSSLRSRPLSTNRRRTRQRRRWPSRRRTGRIAVRAQVAFGGALTHGCGRR